MLDRQITKYVHVYLEDIDMQLAVVFIAKTSNESSNESDHCAVSPEPLLLALKT